MKDLKENLFFPLERREIDEIGIGKTIVKHYHLKSYIPPLFTLYVLVGKTKHQREKFAQVLKKGISVTSIQIKDSDLETIERGDSVSAEYNQFRVIILSDHSLEKLQKGSG